jgi:hypothetical protein
MDAMETLFRFNMVREPNRTADELEPIDLATNSQFQHDAAAIPTGPARREQLHALAADFIGSNRFVGSINSVAELKALDTAATAVDGLIAAGQADRPALDAALTSALGGAAGPFVEAPAVRDRIEAIKDSILAIKLSPRHHHLPLRRLAAVLRVIELCIRFKDDAAFPRDLAELVSVHRRGMRLPEAVLPTRPAVPPRTERPTVAEKLKDLADRHYRLDKVLSELRAIRPHGFSVTLQEAAPERMPPGELRPTKLFEREVAIREASLKATFLSSVADVTRPPGDHQTTINFGTSTVVREALSNLTANNLSTTGSVVPLARQARIALTGSPDFKPVVSGLVGLRLARETQARLSRETLAVLKELGLDPGEPIARTVEKITAEKQRLHAQAQSLIQPVAQKTFRTIGKTTVAITASPMPTIYSLSPAAIIEVLPDIILPGSEGVPTTHADIKPAGIMDLLLVKQQLKGYEGAEVSHIANILKGEKKERVHRTRLETEVITLTEREIETTTERSLETTDRFEIRRESERALQEETGVKGSASIKANYGPTVEFRASVEASWQRKSQEAERAASETARQVTEKASEKITERVLTRETRRVTREVEEIDQHAFDNTTGAQHVSGVYQWVTKVYEAQVFNYGPRTLYDIMIPEPAALLLEAFRMRRSAALELEKPPSFDINPSQLNEDIYEAYVTLYGATDVKPPPQPFVTESYDYNTGGEDKDQEFTNSTRIQVPDGYQAVRATVGQVVTVWDEWSVSVIMGQHSHMFRSGQPWIWSTALDEETGSVPFAMVTDKVGDIALAIEVICEATDRAIDLWRAETHAKLMQAYRARLSEYEAKLAELEAEAPEELASGPSVRNRALMIDEIKRLAISSLTLQHYDKFDAIDEGTGKLPEISFSESDVEGPYVRFFEQAFEWENLSWVPYSYFWGRKSTWLDKIVIEDDDAEFEAFLKAGYLRVQIPVRPGFAEAADHFRLFGEPWFGGSLPAISDDTYLPIADELADRLGRPGDELPVGEPWEVRVPTTLVRLRFDDQLPKWQKLPDGSWSEVGG